MINTPKSLEQFHAFVSERTAADEFSGVVLLEKNGRTLFHEAYGLANRAENIPNKLDTRFSTASVTKMMTAVAVAQLVEQNKIDVAAPIGKYAKFLAPDVASKVHVHHLLTHTSGLTPLWPGGFNTQADVARADPPLAAIRNTRDFLPHVQKQTLQTEPGKTFAYGNIAFVLLGLLVEEVSGQSYEKYLDQHVLPAAGMHHSGMFARDHARPNCAVGYLRKQNPADPWQSDIYFTLPSGGPHSGIFTTTPDLLSFLQKLFANQLLPEPVTRLFTELKVHEDDNLAYSYGFRHLKKLAGKLHAIGHKGAGAGTSAGVFHIVQTGHNIVILSNMKEASDPVLNALGAVLVNSEF